MTPYGTIIRPEASAKEKRLLEAKYSIFLEIAEMQRKWMSQMEDAAKNVLFSGMSNKNKCMHCKLIEL
jgi:hypothetical protein